MTKSLTSSLILFFLIAGFVSANSFLLELAPGDEAIVNCEGELTEVSQTITQTVLSCSSLPTPTPTPTPTPITPTPTPITPTPTPSGNLLINPKFQDISTGQCFSSPTLIILPGWTQPEGKEYFAYGPKEPLMPGGGCAFRAKGEGYPGPGIINIPNGEVGVFWQIVSVTPPYFNITVWATRMEHESGSFLFSIWGRNDPGSSWALIGESSATINQVTNKNGCDGQKQSWLIDQSGGVSVVEFADPLAGCSGTLPDDTLFNVTWGQFTEIKIQFQIDPLPNTSGNLRSGIKFSEAFLGVE